MSTVPPPPRVSARVVVARVVLASPFVLVGVGVGLWSVPAGLVAAGLMAWAEFHLPTRPTK